MRQSISNFRPAVQPPISARYEKMNPAAQSLSQGQSVGSPTSTEQDSVTFSRELKEGNSGPEPTQKASRPIPWWKELIIRVHERLGTYQY